MKLCTVFCKDLMQTTSKSLERFLFSKKPSDICLFFIMGSVGAEDGE